MQDNDVGKVVILYTAAMTGYNQSHNHSVYPLIWVCYDLHISVTTEVSIVIDCPAMP